VRVFLPVSWEQLAELRRRPLDLAVGHAVTDEFRAELAGSDDEELEYAALSAAGADAVSLVTPTRPRRVVLAVDADAHPTGQLSVVTLPVPVVLAEVAAVHIDAPEAASDVLAAAAAPDDETLMERALDHELGWYGVQEIAGLMPE
jgi:hypothetical protein